MTEVTVDTILQALETAGQVPYGTEPVTELEHALQIADIADEMSGDEELILAALLHDIGRVAVRQDEISDTLVPDHMGKTSDGARGPSATSSNVYGPSGDPFGADACSTRLSCSQFDNVPLFANPAAYMCHEPSFGFCATSPPHVDVIGPCGVAWPSRQRPPAPHRREFPSARRSQFTPAHAASHAHVPPTHLPHMLQSTSVAHAGDAGDGVASLVATGPATSVGGGAVPLATVHAPAASGGPAAPVAARATYSSSLP